MNSIQVRLISTGLFFLFIFLSGFWLSRSGKPYPVILFNLHKLIALAAVVFLFLAVYRAQQTVPLGPSEITALVITGLLFAGTILAGGLLSLGKPVPEAVAWVHRLFPYLTMLSSAVTLYLAAG
jgi:hypothetical protein